MTEREKPPQEVFRFRRLSGFAFILVGLILITPCVIWIFDVTLSAANAKSLFPQSTFIWLFAMSLLTIWIGLTFLFDRRVVVRLDETGITDERYSPRPIPWSAINALYEQTAPRAPIILGLILSLDRNSQWFKEQDLGRKPNRWIFPDWPYLQIKPGGYHDFSMKSLPPSLILPLIALPKARIIELAVRWHELADCPSGKRRGS